MVCPICCAQIRNSSCGSCSYYKTAEKYAEHKFRRTGGKFFVIALNEEVDKAVNEALALTERKKLKKAEKHLTQLLSQYPSYHMVQYGMGTLCAFKGQTEEAISHFKKAVDIFPYFAEAYFNLGVAYKNKFDISNMVKCLDKAMRLSDAKTIIHQQAKNLLDALAAFDKALELDPQYELAIVNKAMTETLTEGKKLDNKVKSVEYYKDFPMQNRSYIKSAFPNLKSTL